MLRTGDIVSLLPAVYASTAAEPTDLQRAVAVMLWRPEAVLTLSSPGAGGGPN
jgi:hypothetical protein